MKIYRLENSQVLPISKEEAWEFLASPNQLENITPGNIGFTSTTPIPKTMYEGMIMHYQLRPFVGLKFNWVGQITHIDEGNFFIDEQRLGPFKFWHHEHRVIEHKEGTMLNDIIHYEIGYSFLGRLAHFAFVRRLIEDMFLFRNKKIEDYFQ